MMETGVNRCNIVAAIELDGPPLDLASLTVFMKNALLEAGEPRWPRFMQRPLQTWAGWFWEDVRDSFQMSQHVSSETEVVTLEAMAALLARLQSEPMDYSRPLWNVVLVPYSAKGGCTAIFRLHHSMGDGLALVRVLLQMMDGDSTAAEPVQVGHRTSRSCLQGASHLFWAPLHAVEQMLEPCDEGPLKPRSLTGIKRAALSSKLRLQRIKDIARVKETTVSAVVAACFASALERCGLANGAKHLKFWVPVSVAAAGKEFTEPRNDLSFVMMPLATGSRSAAETLQRTDKLLRELKTSTAAPALLMVIRVVVHLLPCSISQPLLNFIGNKATGVFSSVPGPSSELQWGGRRVSSLRFLVPQRANFCVGLSAVSYAGDICISVSMDEATLANVQGVASAWQDALSELEDSVIAVHAEP